MFSNQYFYLIWTGLFLLIWVLLYALRKDLHKEMIIISSVFGIGGIITEAFYIQDWWQPLTLTGTLIGLEDFLIGFFIGGVASVIYEVLFNRRVLLKKKVDYKNPRLPAILFLFLALFSVSFLVYNINSFYSTLIAFGGTMAVLLGLRRDLILESLASGVLLLVIGIGIYLLLFLFYPNFIREFWFLPDVWFARLWLGIPIGEYIWYFLAGSFIGPLYEFWQEAKLVRNEN